MGDERYELEVGLKAMVFEFTSVSSKKHIRKRVEYQNIGLEDYYNLAFGDVNLETNGIDDKVVSNNDDGEKVLATVASTIYTFIKSYPNAVIFAKGSNSVRTRLYRIGISNNLEELKKQFDVFGFIENVGWLKYEKNVDYSAFYITKK